MKLYKNPMNGDIRDYEGWKEYAVDFYRKISWHDLHPGKKAGDMPEDWWERTKRVLKLEEI